MGASNRRRILRLQLSVNRKLTVIRWIGCATVGVVNTTSTRLKANEGAERSCPSRRRVRGQRIGKRRSRGRQPRSNSPHPTRSLEEPSNRVMNKHLRACDHFYDRQEEFGKFFMQSRLHKMMKVGISLSTDSKESFCLWRTRWFKLRKAILPFGEGVVWCSRIGPTFLYWLEQRFGIVVNWRNGPSVSARRTINDWMDSIRIRNDNYHRRTIGNRSLVPRFILTCAFCRPRRTWTSGLRTGRCPGCSRPVLSGMGGRSNRPRRT